VGIQLSTGLCHWLVVHHGAASGFREEQGKLSELIITLREDKSEISLPLDHLLVFFGMSPKLGAIENWGLQVAYEGKKKLILSGFHEAALAAFSIKSRLDPDAKTHVQYTTTSPVMLERLGVK